MNTLLAEQKPQYAWLSVPAVIYSLFISLQGNCLHNVDAAGGSNKEAGQDRGSPFCCPSEVTLGGVQLSLTRHVLTAVLAMLWLVG